MPPDSAIAASGFALILFGAVLLLLLTANLAAFFIGSDVEKVEREGKEADRLFKEISVRLERIERLLEGRPGTQGMERD